MDEPLSAPRLVFTLMFISRGGFGDGHLGCERRTRNTIPFRSPCSQIRDLTTLRTEWTPGVCFPSRGLVAQGTSHGLSVTSEMSEVQSPEPVVHISAGVCAGLSQPSPTHL